MEYCSGPLMLFRSLFLYTLVECQTGNVTRIDVELDGDSVSVTDNGRGHAIEREVDGVPYLKLIYSQLHAPFQEGKMHAILIHTIGVSLFSAFCEELTVEARKNRRIVCSHFRDAVHVGTEETDNALGKTGNAIRFRFSKKRLTESLHLDEVKDYMQKVKTAYPDLELTLNNAPIIALESL